MSRTLSAIAVRVAVVTALGGWPVAGIALAQSSPASVENTRSQDRTQPPRADGSPDLTTVGERRSATPNVSAKYTLGVSDEVVIHALDAPEISEKPLRINPDGELRLALVGRIQAAGMTVAQLEEELKKRLAVILQEPDVTVTVTAARSQSISIMGAVTSPGVKPLETGSTILDMLSVADGVTPDAGSVVRIVRKADQGQNPACRSRKRYPGRLQCRRVGPPGAPRRPDAGEEHRASAERPPRGAQSRCRLCHRRSRQARTAAAECEPLAHGDGSGVDERWRIENRCHQQGSNPAARLRPGGTGRD